MIFQSFLQTFFLLIFLIIFWSVLGIGATQVFRKMVKDTNDRSEAESSFSTFLAVGMTVWFCLGSFLLSIGYFNFWSFALVFFLFIGIARLHLKSHWQSCVLNLKSFVKQFEQITKWETTLVVFIIVFFVLSMVSFVAPIESDGAAYYLPIAKLWAESGLIQMLRGYDDFSSIGAFAEVQLALIYLLDGEVLARGIFALVPVLISVEFFKFSKKLNLSLQSFLYQVLALYTSMCVVLVMYSGKIDLLSAWLGLLSIYCLFFDRNLLKAGLFLGAAGVAKISLLVPMFFVTVTALVYRATGTTFRQINWRTFLVEGFKLAGPFLFVVFWQLLKNHIIFDNPWAPFLGSQMGEEQIWFSPETLQRIKLLYPLVWFYGDYWGQLGSFSILVLMFLPLAWLGYRTKRDEFPSLMKVVPYWCVMFLVGMTFWFLLRPSMVAPRYIMGFFLIAFPLMGLGYDGFNQANSHARLKQWIVRGMIVLFSIHIVGLYLRYPISPLRAYYSFTTPLSKCKWDGPDCVAMEILNETAEPGARVMQLIYESYWLRPDLLQTLRGFYELDGIENLAAEEKWKKIVAHKFSFILLKASTHNDRISKVGLSDVPPWIELKLLFNQYGVAVWKIEVLNSAPEIQPAVDLIQDRNGWHVQKIP